MYVEREREKEKRRERERNEADIKKKVERITPINLRREWELR